jgi:hypothetical protein
MVVTQGHLLPEKAPCWKNMMQFGSDARQKKNCFDLLQDSTDGMKIISV